MHVRRLGVSEVRQRLPELVEQIARDGGRIDVTVRGRARVSIVRTSTSSLSRTPDRSVSPALRIELKVPSRELVRVIRELRSRTGGPRPLPRRRARPRRVRRG